MKLDFCRSAHVIIISSGRPLLFCAVLLATVVYLSSTSQQNKYMKVKYANGYNKFILTSLLVKELRTLPRHSYNL